MKLIRRNLLFRLLGLTGLGAFIGLGLQPTTKKLTKREETTRRRSELVKRARQDMRLTETVSSYDGGHYLTRAGSARAENELVIVEEPGRILALRRNPYTGKWHYAGEYTPGKYED